MVKKKNREELRNKYAEEMCREVRYQIANNTHDEWALFDILTKWMKVAKKNKWVRPKPKKRNYGVE